MYSLTGIHIILPQAQDLSPVSESEIKSMKIFTFRKLVYEKISELSIKYLLSLKIKNNEEKNK